MRLKLRDVKKTISLAGYVYAAGLFICLAVAVVCCLKNYLAGKEFQTTVHMNLYGEAWIELIILSIVGVFIFVGLYFEIKATFEKKE